ncbi:hypothetical protein BD770DRAFT_411101 [Pilaira anomala]|nr:hypothetical protein BD770DRAFT_411101 [Pilaira anomala]
MAADEALVWSYTAIQSKNKAEKKVAASLATVLKNLAQRNVQTMKEPLFCSQLVEPVVCPFIPQSGDFKLKGSSEESEGSRARRGTEGRKPDLSLSTQVGGVISTPFSFAK